MHIRDLFDLTGKTALVTGGSMGLGFQMATALVEAGADVAICARNLERCQQAAKELEKCEVFNDPSRKPKVAAFGCDVTNPSQVEATVSAVLDTFGAIDILVNNAGTSWAAPPEKLKLENWNKVMAVNVTGTFLCCQAVGRHMIERGKGGKIINIASSAGLRGRDPKVLDTIAYNTSKGAVVTFTKDLAVKWAKHNINVNAIAPGFFRTHLSEWVLDHRLDLILPKIPMGRIGKDYELKGAVVFLASKASDYVTGHILLVEGGSTAW